MKDHISLGRFTRPDGWQGDRCEIELCFEDGKVLERHKQGYRVRSSVLPDTYDNANSVRYALNFDGRIARYYQPINEAINHA